MCLCTVFCVQTTNLQTINNMVCLCHGIDDMLFMVLPKALPNFAWDFNDITFIHQQTCAHAAIYSPNIDGQRFDFKRAIPCISWHLVLLPGVLFIAVLLSFQFGEQGLWCSHFTVYMWTDTFPVMFSCLYSLCVTVEGEEHVAHLLYVFVSLIHGSSWQQQPRFLAARLLPSVHYFLCLPLYNVLALCLRPSSLPFSSFFLLPAVFLLLEHHGAAMGVCHVVPLGI